VLRQEKELTLKVSTELTSGTGTSRIVIWAGAAIQGRV